MHVSGGGFTIMSTAGAIAANTMPPARFLNNNKYLKHNVAMISSGQGLIPGYCHLYYSDTYPNTTMYIQPFGTLTISNPTQPGTNSSWEPFCMNWNLF